MVDWIEYVIARHAAQLRAEAAVRPLTKVEQETLSRCQSAISILEIRESLPEPLPGNAAISRPATPKNRRPRTLNVRWRERRAS
jgi:hypothetical protein